MDFIILLLELCSNTEMNESKTKDNPKPTDQIRKDKGD